MIVQVYRKYIMQKRFGKPAKNEGKLYDRQGSVVQTLLCFSQVLMVQISGFSSQFWAHYVLSLANVECHMTKKDTFDQKSRLVWRGECTRVNR